MPRIVNLPEKREAVRKSRAVTDGPRVRTFIDPEPPAPRRTIATEGHHMAYDPHCGYRAELARHLTARARAIVDAEPFTGYYSTG